jgi:hypothetical protein
MNTSHVILKGFPPDDSIAVSQMVTLHQNETDYKLSEEYWNNTITDATDAKVVEVRLILWWV